MPHLYRRYAILCVVDISLARTYVSLIYAARTTTTTTSTTKVSIFYYETLRKL